MNLQPYLGAALGLGLDAKELGAAHMALRAVVVYAVTLVFVRLAKKRFMGHATAFDVILGIMLGAIVSRAITGTRRSSRRSRRARRSSPSTGFSPGHPSGRRASATW